VGRKGNRKTMEVFWGKTVWGTSKLEPVVWLIGARTTRRRATKQTDGENRGLSLDEGKNMGSLETFEN
jgi:hypothetical protein